MNAGKTEAHQGRGRVLSRVVTRWRPGLRGLENLEDDLADP